METRILLVKKGCIFCRRVMKAVNRINIRSPFNKRIRIIDCYEYEEYGLNNIPLMKKMHEELKDGYPCFYLSGILIETFPTIKMTIKFLEKFLEDELIY